MLGKIPHLRSVILLILHNSTRNKHTTFFVVVRKANYQDVRFILISAIHVLWKLKKGWQTFSLKFPKLRKNIVSKTQAIQNFTEGLYARTLGDIIKDHSRNPNHVENMRAQKTNLNTVITRTAIEEIYETDVSSLNPETGSRFSYEMLV